jgi:poly(3-hydroxybutyrate) depolymerase
VGYDLKTGQQRALRHVPNRPVPAVGQKDMWILIRSIVIGCLALVSVAACSVHAPAGLPTSDASSAARIDRFSYSGPPPASGATFPAAKVYEYQVYVPAGHETSKAWPLVVYVHACGTSADLMRLSSAMSPIADSEDFLVMYPDNQSDCWRGLGDEPTRVNRGAGGDADIIAHMTKEAMAKYNVDPQRVYIFGASGGGFMTSATVAAYPDLYAAAGVMAGGGTGMGAACMTFPDRDDPAFARTMVDRMGANRRVVPFFSYGGTADALGESFPTGGCARRAFLQTMGANNIINPWEGGDRYRADLSKITGQVPDGHTWTKHVWRDNAGCVIGERWVVDGMGHDVGGGHPDHSDTKAPNSSQAAWTFFKRFRKADTGGNCAESRD